MPHILRTESIKIVKWFLCIVASLHQDKTESMVKVRSKGHLTLSLSFVSFSNAIKVARTSCDFFKTTLGIWEHTLSFNIWSSCMVIGVILPSTLLHSVFRRRIRDFSAFSAAASSFADFFCRSLSFWAARRLFLDECAFLCLFAGFFLVLHFVLLFFFFLLTAVGRRTAG